MREHELRDGWLSARRPGSNSDDQKRQHFTTGLRKPALREMNCDKPKNKKDARYHCFDPNRG